MPKRSRKKQTRSLHDRLANFAQRATEEAEKLPPGPAQDVALRKARQAKAGAEMDEWLASTGWKPPKQARLKGASRHP